MLLTCSAASEANAAPPPPPLRPGILIVTLHEGRGFSLPAGSEAAFNTGHHQGSLSTGGGFSVAGSMRPNSSSRNQVAGSYSSNRPQSAAGSINAVPTIHGRYSSKYLPYALVDFDKQQVFINAVSGTPENPLWAGGNTQYKFDVSRVTDLTVSLYVRNPSAPPNAGRNEDIFIGTCKVNPRFEESHSGDAKAKKDKEQTAQGQIGADWIDIQFGTGSMRIGVNFVENRQDRLSIDDFDLLKVVGKGSFGKVMQVMYVDMHFNGDCYAYNGIGRRTRTVSTPSRPFARLTSSPARKWRTLSLNDLSLLRSTIPSSCRSSSPSSLLRNFIWFWHLSMVASFSIIFRKNSGLISTARDSTQRSFSVP